MTIDPATIVSLAVKFVEGMASGGGEKLTEKLWNAIKNRFSGRKMEAEIAKIEQNQDPAAIKRLEKSLDTEMYEDDEFAGEVQQLAQHIINLTQNQTQTQNNNNHGRDQFIVNNPTGELKLGGS
ncbi:MAG: hypothetical protein SWY16_19635 [Cyanobacteriota bacterium]|nr:hypothetical protein [Cyanobacteriota bacterium]